MSKIERMSHNFACRRINIPSDINKLLKRPNLNTLVNMTIETESIPTSTKNL